MGRDRKNEIKTVAKQSPSPDPQGSFASLNENVETKLFWANPVLCNTNAVFSRLTVINFLEESETGTKCTALKGEGVDRQPILSVQMICSHDMSADSGLALVFWLKASHSPYIRHRQKDTVFRRRMSSNMNPNAEREGA